MNGFNANTDWEQWVPFSKPLASPTIIGRMTKRNYRARYSACQPGTFKQFRQRMSRETFLMHLIVNVSCVDEGNTIIPNVA
jgi:hypothetical protein